MALNFRRPPQKEQVKLRPEILTHPNIPKPLHGLNPRTLLGKEWWDKTRLEAQAKYSYCCAACGVSKEEAKGPKWLEGHEYFNIDYTTGICEVVEIVPLCHYCHNFIHSGRLYSIIGTEKTKQEAIEILEHGFNILRKNNLSCFEGTTAVANILGVPLHEVNVTILPETDVKWEDYRLLLDGKEYKSKFNNYEEWYNYYT